MKQADPARTPRGAAWLNLVLPGAGLLLIGRWTSGLLAGLLFTLSTNLAITAVFLFPDDFSPAPRGLAIGVMAASYVGAQLRMAQAARGAELAARAARRRALLAEAEKRLAAGQAANAAAILRPLAEEQPDDLLASYRLAEALQAAGDAPAAQRAWQRVREVDRHGIYREQLRAAGSSGRSRESTSPGSAPEPR